MGRTFGIDFSRPRWGLSKLEPMLEAVHERLEDVLIECLDFGTCIERYDSRAGTLFYCDPPYWGRTDDYGKDIFSEADFDRLRSLLGGLQGHFVLSINDRPEVRDLFVGFEMEEVSLNYRASGKPTPARELIIWA